MDTLEHLNQSLFLLINADPASPAWRIQAGMFIANRLILLVLAALAGLWLWAASRSAAWCSRR